MDVKAAKRVCYGLILSAGVLVIIMLSLIITSIISRQQRVEASVCFHEHVRLKNGFEKTKLLNHLTFEYRNNKNITHYCIKASDALNLIVNKQVHLRYDTNINPESLSYNRTVVNCTLSDEKPSVMYLKDIGTIDTKGNSSTIHWKTFMRDGNGLRYDDNEGTIAIQKPGFYYIASQLTIMRKSNATNAKHNDQLKYQVMRISENTHTENVLLENAHSPCELAVEKCEESNYMAAAFRLELNDKIYVVVSKQEHVVLENKNHFISVIEI